MIYGKVSILVALFVLGAASAQAADIAWEAAGSSYISSGQLKVTGPFSVKVVPSGVSSVQRVDFYINGKFIRTERWAPYYLFGDNNGAPIKGTFSGPTNIEARVFSGGTQVYTEKLTVASSSTTTSFSGASTLPAGMSPVSGNKLVNYDFSSGTYGWSTFAGKLYATNGIARLDRVYGEINHFGQRLGTPVSPGQKIVIKAKVRAGAKLSSTSNTGCGIGLDFREYQTGRPALIGTLNGPATTSQNWVIITQAFTIPWRNSADTTLPTSSYSVIDAQTGAVLQSTTYHGSRWGRSNNYDNSISDPANLAMYYQSHNYPSKLSLTQWDHNWFNTMKYCEYDWISMSVA